MLKFFAAFLVLLVSTLSPAHARQVQIQTPQRIGGGTQYDELQLTPAGKYVVVETPWILTTTHIFTNTELVKLYNWGYLRELGPTLTCNFRGRKIIESAIEVNTVELNRLGVRTVIVNPKSLPTLRISEGVSLQDPSTWINRSTSPSRSALTGRRFEQRSAQEMILTLRQGDSGSSPITPYMAKLPNGQVFNFSIPQFVLYAGYGEGKTQIFGWSITANGAIPSMVRINRKNQIEIYNNVVPNECKFGK